ncbi:MAG: O-antigen ligase family protein [Betaproteobacteria bacterium]
MSASTRASISSGAAAMSRQADRIAQFSAVGLGFSVPLTIALNNILLGLTLLGWLLGSGLHDRLRAFTHPGAVPTVALFGLLAAGALYAEPDTAQSMLHVKKYLDLILIPIFLHLFRDAAVRRHAVIAFASSMAGVLLASFMIKGGLIPELPFLQGNAENPVVFKHHLTHNILMAFGVFLFAWLALEARSAGSRAIWSALALLALVNVTLMVHGASGYLVLIGLMVFLASRRAHWLALAMAGVTVLFIAGALVVGNNPLEQRARRIASEFQAWETDKPAQSSVGLRLEFYGTTLGLITDHPLIGVGTGGFASAYAEKVKDTGKVATQNPHNEFLLMWAQLGIAGLAALIWMFARQWRLAAQLPTRLESELARGLVVTMVIGCMLNSLLLDHTEGLFYAWLTGVLYGGLKWPLPDKDARSATRTIAPTPVP